MMEVNAIMLIFMIIALGALLMTGYPVAFTLAGVSVLTTLISIGLSQFSQIDIGLLDWRYISLFPDRILGTMRSEILLAVPLFVFMGTLLERSKIADDLLSTMSQLFGGLRGGLGISAVLVGAILAASTGIVGATVTTMALISLPTMLKRGYDPAFASGTIAAAGTLGQIIPPSIILVLLSDVLSTAYQNAQREMNIFSPSPLSTGDLFAGAFIPGICLVFCYILYQLIVAYFKPEACPPNPTTRDIGILQILAVLAPPFLLIIAVLGSIIMGIATPTAAASVGAVGALFLGAIKADQNYKKILITGLFSTMLLLIIPNYLTPIAGGFGTVILIALTIISVIAIIFALWICFRSKLIQPAMDSTLNITTMVFTIFICASLFALVFRGLGGDDYVADFLTAMPGGTFGAVAVVMLVMFLLGFFLDFIEITFIVVPIVAPILLMMGLDPIWLGIMMAINLQTSFLTPPFGFAIFYLKGVAPNTITTATIYKGVIPFVVIQVLFFFILAYFPELATWLPSVIFGS